MTSPEEWAAKELIEARSNDLEGNLDRWTKYDKLRMSEDLDQMFEYLLSEAHLNERGRRVVEQAKLSYEKIFYNEVSPANRTH
tara:strand:- start:1163 stop:1411 length:249 start_codon:yes stop_codon:yes gene_type:complete